MPPRPTIDPYGIYHVGSRGTYGRTLFHTLAEHELFLDLYGRAARKYAWHTFAWTLMKNHHHFVVELTRGGLSEGMREIHTGYSRRIHAIYGQTRKGHLFRHAFFARPLLDDRDVIGTCAYVDLNPSAHRRRPGPRKGDWCSLAATFGLEKRRPFHHPDRLLRLLGSDVDESRAAYCRAISDEHARGQAEAFAKQRCQTRDVIRSSV